LPVPLILLELITWVLFGDEYRSWSSSPWNFLQPPVTVSLYGPNIFLTTLFPKTFNLSLPSVWDVKFQHHTKRQSKL
jgi:hypothetical protein